MDSKKILNLVTIVMFVITVVLLGLFMFGGEVPNSTIENGGLLKRNTRKMQ